MARKLFEPYTIKDVTLKNRIVMSPMCMYSAEQDGKVNDWHLVHYPARAVGQVGLIMVEATGVTPEGRISERDLGIWSDEHIDGLKRLVSLIKPHGAKTAIQLAHAGRKAEVRGEILAPSALAFDETMRTPKEMTKEDIERTVQAFADGARRAKKAGFDIIELHGAHGYLINEFLSPLTNHREDEYGGSPANRLRFLTEIITEVKKVWNGPLFVRVSASDYHPEGLTAEDYVPIAQQLKELGVDLIDTSSGAVVPAKIQSFPGYQVKFAETIKHGADIPTGAVGMINSAMQAEEILRNERADLIFLGRELLRDPYWPRTAARELRTQIDPPKQYERGWQ
ncbi:NADPH dehydrogenase NamA [Bacillus thermotolerans]|uniref:NADPH dehydrogenase NamA n=1 Tax=Bacillus thermotolerans TaxID=1221996 RepID=UPI00057E5546|nr:NADPH dehydrogenase NamA [Bacillus thermotolerans]KKB37206.1 NADPH dehydrogenase [Bacillus thermotolerans]